MTQSPADVIERAQLPASKCVEARLTRRRPGELSSDGRRRGAEDCNQRPAAFRHSPGPSSTIVDSEA